jgi:hypothetical protein
MKKSIITTAIETVTPENRASLINEIAEQVIADVRDGNVSALQTLAKLRFMNTVFEQIEEGIKADAIEELTNFPEKEGANIYGFKIKTKYAGGKYLYENCNHPEYNQILISLKPLLERKKEIETTLKTIKNSMIITDEETGETSKVFEPAHDGGKLTIEVSKKR